MVQCLVNINESELPSQAVTVFLLVIKEMCCVVFSNGRLKTFCWIIPSTFCCMMPSAGSIGSNACFEYCDFPEEAHNRGLLSNLTIYTVSLSLDEDQSLMWLVVGLFACPTISSIPHYWSVTTFHHPSEFVFKNGAFSLNLNWVTCGNMVRRFFFPLIWNPNIKVINITKLVQVIFNAWFGYLENGSYPLHDILIWLPSNSTGLPDQIIVQ